MGRNSASPDLDSNGGGGDDIDTAVAGQGFRSIRDRIRFKRHPNRASAPAPALPLRIGPRRRRCRIGSGAAADLTTTAAPPARRFLLFPFRGRSLFYFCAFFAVFVFALASMVLQSSIASVFRSGRSVREGLKFGSSLKFVPWGLDREFGLDRLRSQPRLGVRPPRLALSHKRFQSCLLVVVIDDVRASVILKTNSDALSEIC
ncbi:hypothetical protein Acr_27g0001670 [Actinidia rufa]|uniref:Uncharacterized protein n=1 Tax=Actinidia rufa TaxID=165716 RepID=A0A7J0H5X5_9ERIC|nr:hypothetical protein Acr_27g0001670 [Actinidia rufa]